MNNQSHPPLTVRCRLASGWHSQGVVLSLVLGVLCNMYDEQASDQSFIYVAGHGQAFDDLLFTVAFFLSKATLYLMHIYTRGFDL